MAPEAAVAGVDGEAEGETVGVAAVGEFSRHPAPEGADDQIVLDHGPERREAPVVEPDHAFMHEGGDGVTAELRSQPAAHHLARIAQPRQTIAARYMDP